MQEGISGFAGDPPEGTCRPYHFLMSRIQGITFGDPLEGVLQRLNEPCGSSFIFPQSLLREISRRDLGKINDPAWGGIHLIFAERGGFEPPVPF